jgi:hypothetical protein
LLRCKCRLVADFVAEVSDQQNVALSLVVLSRQLPPVPLGAVP